MSNNELIEDVEEVEKFPTLDSMENLYKIRNDLYKDLANDAVQTVFSMIKFSIKASCIQNLYNPRRNYQVNLVANFSILNPVINLTFEQRELVVKLLEDEGFNIVKTDQTQMITISW